MENISALVQPYDELSDIVSETKSALGSCERLAIILKRIQASDQLFESLQDKKSAQKLKLSSKKSLFNDLYQLLNLYPVEITHGWEPSENFIKDFWDEKYYFDADDNIIGGPYSTATYPFKNYPLPLSENETSVFQRDSDDSRRMSVSEIEWRIKEFGRSSAVLRVQKEIFEYFRRGWLLDESIPTLIPKTTFWELAIKNDEISEIYEENPLRTISDFFSHFVNGNKVETNSSNSPIPQASAKLLAEIINVIFDRLLVDESVEHRLLKNYKSVIISEQNCMALLGNAAHLLHTEQNIGKLLSESVSVIVPDWAIPIFCQCIPNILKYLDSITTPYIHEIFSSDDDNEIPNVDLNESLLAYFLIVLGRYAISKIADRHEFDVSKLIINSQAYLSNDGFLNYHRDSEKTINQIKEIANNDDSTQASGKADFLLQYFELHEDIERERLIQLSRISQGSPQPTLNLKCCGYTHAEYTLKLKSFENFEVETVISACMAILVDDSEIYWKQNKDALLNVILRLNELQMPKIAAAMLIIALEAYQEKSAEYSEGEEAEFWDGFSFNICRKLYSVYDASHGNFRADLNVAFSRLFSKLDLSAQKRLLAFFPYKLLLLDTDIQIDPKKILRRYLGTFTFEKLAEHTISELLLAEKHFRDLTLRNSRKGQVSIPAAIVHWSRALESILKKIVIPLVKNISPDDVIDQSRSVIRKVQSGHASMGELTTVLLEFKKKTKGALNQNELIARFESSPKLLSLVQNSEYRDQLRLLSKLRNLASHDAEVTIDNVFLFKYSLVTTGLLRDLSDVCVECS